MTARRCRRSTSPRRAAASASSPCPTCAGSAATSSRCRCCRTCWPSSGRWRPGAYEAWLVDDDGHGDRGHRVQRLDRHRATACCVTHAGRPRHPQRHHPQLRSCGWRRSVGSRLERAAVHASPRRSRRAEAFLTSTTSLVKPVVRIDDAPVGDGRRAAHRAACSTAYGARRRADAGVMRDGRLRSEHRAGPA